MKSLTLGYSPCPNDTFIFYAMIHGKIDTKNLQFKEILLDVETLNQKALRNELDLTKVSFHAFAHVHKNYCMLRAGGAMGKGCGPLIVAKDDLTIEELRNKKIAIPGKLTTAFLLLQLFDRSFIPLIPGPWPLAPVVIEMPFHKIMDAVANGEVDAGLIIHESRFTYPSYGLKQIIDLGQWWEKQTGLPIPLGAILSKRTLGEGLLKKINKIIRSGIEYSFNNRAESMDYIKRHSQELSDAVINRHIDLYVNNYSLDVGEDGEKAVRELFARSEEAGIIPKIKQGIFI